MSAINAAVKGAPSSFPWNLTQPHVHRPIKLVGEIVAHEVMHRALIVRLLTLSSDHRAV